MSEHAPTEPLPNLAGILQGIEQAEALNMVVDEYTAREIALALEAPEDSATRQFAITGFLDHERLIAEMHAEGVRRTRTDFEKRMIERLGTFAVDRWKPHEQ